MKTHPKAVWNLGGYANTEVLRRARWSTCPPALLSSVGIARDESKLDLAGSGLEGNEQATFAYRAAAG